MHTTQEVCSRLGITPAALNSWLSRHPKFKPTGRDGKRWAWSDAEVEALRQAHAETAARNRNKPKKVL